MYAVYRQAHTPTAVEFSVCCNFVSSKEKNLVVAGTSQLFVYRIIHDVEVNTVSTLKKNIILAVKLIFLFAYCPSRVHHDQTNPQVCCQC